MLSGVLRYYDTAYERNVPEVPVVWSKGSARLLDYGCRVKNIKSVVLFVPSLINRYYILDLEEKRSFMRYLASEGIYPLLLDWGVPSDAEKDFNCADYVTEILCPTIDFINKISGSISIAGYCMGGVLALAASKIVRKKISSLALLATPWDFHCPQFKPFILEEKWQKEMNSQIDKNDFLPAQIIQSLFYLTDPFVFEHKFCRYSDLAENGAAAKEFVALEHWVNDGVPMTAKVGSDCLVGWAQRNALSKEEWLVSGKKVTPPSASLPTFIAIPKNDNVVPYECAMPLARKCPNAHIIRPKTGHVGMVVGKNAKKELWEPYTDWLLSV